MQESLDQPLPVRILGAIRAGDEVGLARAARLAAIYVYKDKAERWYLSGLNGANVEKPGGKGFSCSVGNVALYVIILQLSFGLV